ncbi:hypothetical protein GALMADRAFT_148818 [Galerina marginata CBS 339.88]|uniref:Uncharacterized protein n=1 Tax=Galerina marginata (strain CBS 339.88) TaxID=685588 RepID=A0A067SES2_GALM3|nr:hypothetical protein GALMADRAFT_148818 [Galerina marginata CBS 339.88]
MCDKGIATSKRHLQGFVPSLGAVAHIPPVFQAAPASHIHSLVIALCTADGEGDEVQWRVLVHSATQLKPASSEDETHQGPTRVRCTGRRALLAAVIKDTNECTSSRFAFVDLCNLDVNFVPSKTRRATSREHSCPVRYGGRKLSRQQVPMHLDSNFNLKGFPPHPPSHPTPPPSLTPFPPLRAHAHSRSTIHTASRDTNECSSTRFVLETGVVCTHIPKLRRMSSLHDVESNTRRKKRNEEFTEEHRRHKQYISPVLSASCACACAYTSKSDSESSRHTTSTTHVDAVRTAVSTIFTGAGAGGAEDWGYGFLGAFFAAAAAACLP